MCNNFLQQMEIDALEQLISEDVKVQGQIVRDGFRTCLVDDIVFGGSSNSLVARFAEDMSREIEMSMMGKLQFFLGLQIKQ
jgi:hypothetical protein